jgi:glucokinase
MDPVVLVGDIGGTHARLSLRGPSGRAVRTEVFESRGYASLEAIVQAFLAGMRPKPKISAAAFGVAGPVVKGRCVATNLPWVIDQRVLARVLSIKRVTLLNDLVALALGTLDVRAARLHPLTERTPKKRGGANIAVLAAGTGLGEAMLVWDGARFVPSATEGGHADFAPCDDLQIELLRFLRERFGHVSWERVLSGGGLGNVYDFFVRCRGMVESPDTARAIADALDRNAAIADLGSRGKSEAASRAVRLFASVYGAEAGNLALKTLAVGGVYICGNIAARMVGVLDEGGFREAFVDKGRFRPLMETIPVAVVLDTDVGLSGAARVAFWGSWAVKEFHAP